MNQQIPLRQQIHEPNNQWQVLLLQFNLLSLSPDDIDQLGIWRKLENLQADISRLTMVLDSHKTNCKHVKTAA